MSEVEGGGGMYMFLNDRERIERVKKMWHTGREKRDRQTERLTETETEREGAVLR